jgi:hypothetical protein
MTAAEIAIIRTEVLTATYATQRNAGLDQAIADMLNAVSQSIDIDRGVIDAYEIIDATTPTEYAALTAAEKERYLALTGAGKVNTKSANVRAAFQAMFGGATTTRTALAALQTRKGSRAEQLLGAGKIVTHQDVAQALRG